MIDLTELDPAELARIHDVPTELVRCRHCRFARNEYVEGGLAYCTYCTYWGDTVDPKACCTSWQPRRRRKESDGIDRLKQLPAAESDFITCADCRYADGQIADGRYWCDLHGTFMRYCSDAERRKG